MICDQCGKGFASLSGLARHSKKIHTHSAKYFCEFCHKMFNEMSHFKGHMSSHIKHKAYTCSTCHRSFQYKTSLRRHQKTCDKISARLKSASKVTKNQCVLCEICGAEFSRQDSLKDHMNCKHKRDKSYGCIYCGTRFLWRSSLSKHINTKHIDTTGHDSSISSMPDS